MSGLEHDCLVCVRSGARLSCVCVSGLEHDCPTTDREEEEKKDSESDSEQSDDESHEPLDENLQPVETPYAENTQEELGQVRVTSRSTKR